MKRSLRVIALPALLAVCSANPVLGQATSPSSVQLAAMKPFEQFVGQWAGSGWSMDRTGQRVDFNYTETVARRVGGTVLLMDGRGTSKADASKVTHDGLVLLYFDEHTSTYRWNGHDASMGTADTEARLVKGGFEWTIKTNDGGATVRFTILFDDKHWREVGEASMDGKNWGKFMEMNLERVATSAK